MNATPVSVPGKPTALVAGGTGLIGGQLLPLLCGSNEFERVVAVSRRPLAYDHPRLANRIARFEELERSLENVRADVAFCALGTTRSAAGSQEAFRAVDFEMVLAFARAAHRAGVQRMVLVSAVGADPASGNFYLRVKGEVEAEVARLNFAALDILQPSLLLGWRKEVRPLELAAMAASPVFNLLLIGGAQRFRAIGADTVAAAMLGAVRNARKGIHRYTHRGIRELAALAGKSTRTRAALAG